MRYLTAVQVPDIDPATSNCVYNALLTSSSDGNLVSTNAGAAGTPLDAALLPAAPALVLTRIPSEKDTNRQI